MQLSCCLPGVWPGLLPLEPRLQRVDVSLCNPHQQAFTGMTTAAAECLSCITTHARGASLLLELALVVPVLPAHVPVEGDAHLRTEQPLAAVPLQELDSAQGLQAQPHKRQPGHTAALLLQHKHTGRRGMPGWSGACWRACTAAAAAGWVASKDSARKASRPGARSTSSSRSARPCT